MFSTFFFFFTPATPGINIMLVVGEIYVLQLNEAIASRAVFVVVSGSRETKLNRSFQQLGQNPSIL